MTRANNAYDGAPPSVLELIANGMPLTDMQPQFVSPESNDNKPDAGSIMLQIQEVKYELSALKIALQKAGVLV